MLSSCYYTNGCCPMLPNSYPPECINSRIYSTTTNPVVYFQNVSANPKLFSNVCSPSTLTTISNKIKPVRTQKKVIIERYPRKDVNLSAKWAMQHPEILEDFFMTNFRDQSSMTIKTLNSRVRKVGSRQGKKSDKMKRKIITSSESIRRLSDGKSIDRKSIDRKSIDRKSIDRKSIDRKSIDRNSSKSIKSKKTIDEQSSDRKSTSKSSVAPKLVGRSITNTPPPRPVSPDVYSPPPLSSPSSTIKSPVSLSKSPIKPTITNIRRFLPSTDKIDKYENVVGELKKVISKYADTENYVKPSEIAKSLNRKVPPIIPPPPHVETAFQGKPLRHVTPPATPKLGRVLNSPTPEEPIGQSKPFEAPYAYSRIERQISDNEYPMSASSHERFPFSQQELTPGSYETEILKYLPEEFGPNGPSKYLASDGTEWDVIVVKPGEDELAILNRLLKETNQSKSPVQIERMSDILERAKESELDGVEIA